VGMAQVVKCLPYNPSTTKNQVILCYVITHFFALLGFELRALPHSRQVLYHLSDTSSSIHFLHCSPTPHADLWRFFPMFYKLHTDLNVKVHKTHSSEETLSIHFLRCTTISEVSARNLKYKHKCFHFVLKMRSCYIAHSGPRLLGSNNPLTSGS
jgi:hypothetical protein